MEQQRQAIREINELVREAELERALYMVKTMGECADALERGISRIVAAVSRRITQEAAPALAPRSSIEADYDNALRML